MSKQDELQASFIEMGINHFETNKVGAANIYQRVGKIKISLLIMKGLFKNRDYSVLITYPDNKIKEGWQKDMIKWDYKNEDVTFVNFSSLKKFTENHFDFVVVDEIHSIAPSDLELGSLQKIVENSGKCLALSGTISEGTEEHLLQSLGMNVFVRYSGEQAIQDGIVANYNITVHKVDLNNTIKTKNSKGQLVTEKKRYDNFTYVINKNKESGKDSKMLYLNRNRLSQNSIAKRNRVLQLISQNRDKRFLVFNGTSILADSLGIPSFHSKSKNDKNIQDFKEGKINTLALVNIGKTGSTYLNLDGAILNNFTGNEEEMSQTVARTVLLDYAEKISEIHIICANEKAEIKKLQNALTMINENRVTWK